MNRTALAATLALGLMACAPIYEDAAVVYPDGDLALVDVAPGVRVTAGWDAPLFWADDAWWYWNGATWWMWGGTDWTWAVPPRGLATIEPWRYRGFGGPGVLRDHRWTNGWGRPAGAGRWSRDARGASRSSPRWSQPASWRGSRGGGMIRNHRR